MHHNSITIGNKKQALIPTAAEADSLGLFGGSDRWFHGVGRIRAMVSAVNLRTDYSASDLRLRTPTR